MFQSSEWASVGPGHRVEALLALAQGTGVYTCIQ